MAKSPITSEMDIVSLTILVQGKKIHDSYQIISCEVHKEAYKVSTATIIFAFPYNPEEHNLFEISEGPDFVPGNEIAIKAGYNSQEEYIFKGIIVNQGISATSGSLPVLKVKCSDKAVKLTLGRSSRYYSAQKESDLLAGIINDSGLTAAVDATGFIHQQLVQYEAIDWDFIVTRAQANGMLVYFENDKLHVKKPVIDDSCGLVLTFGQDVYSFNGELDARFQMPGVTAHSWNVEDQKLQEAKSMEPVIHDQGNISGKKLADVPGLSAYEINTTGPVDQPELALWAQADLLRARLAALRGKVTFIGNALPQVNKIIDLGGFGNRFNGKALISSVRHVIQAGTWETTIGFGLDPEWYHETRNINAPQAGGLLPAIHGLQNGIVLKIDDDPQGEHRILVQVPVMGTSGEGIWARQALDYATSGKGHFFRPEVGDEVVLGFLNDDPRYAVILGSLYSSNHPPHYTSDQQNSIKAIITNSELKIEFNDKDKILTIETPAGNSFVLSDKDKSITVADQQKNKISMTSSGISMESCKNVVIKAPGNIDLMAGQNIVLKTSGGDVSLEGTNIEAKAKGSFSAQGNASAELKASGQTTVKGAVVIIN